MAFADTVVWAQDDDASTNGLAAVSTSILLPHTRFATRSYDIQATAPGPTVLVVGGVHGNEPAGAFAAEAIRHWNIQSGRLIVIPAANVTGLAANQRHVSGWETNLNDLNRDYPRAHVTNDVARGEIAQAIWKIAVDDKADWVLDLHEGYDFHQLNAKSVGSSIICFPLTNAQTVADEMLAAVNATITTNTLMFVRRNMPVDGSLARAAGEYLHVPGMTIETTKIQPLEKRIEQHEVMVHALLKHLGMIATPLDLSHQTLTTNIASLVKPPQIMVAIYKGPGTGGHGPPNLLKKLNEANAPTSLTEVSAEQIREGVLTNYDVVIFGGGSGSAEAKSLGEAGRAAVEKFVGNGGGYVGICAGAYLATAGYPWSLHIINARTLSPKWSRGKTVLKLELTKPGREILGGDKSNLDCLYHNGPVVGPANQADLPAYEPLAFYRTEVASNNTPVGIMINSPAIFAGQFKEGKVICISPHPEQTDGLDYIVPHAVNWVAPVGEAMQ